LTVKGKKNHIFRSVGFADWFLGFKDVQNSRQNRSKNKLALENAVTQASGIKLLAPGYGLLKSKVFFIQSKKWVNS